MIDKNSLIHPHNIYRGCPEKMREDKRRYGALDGDWARHCIKCGSRFAGFASLTCPDCEYEGRMKLKKPARKP